MSPTGGQTDAEIGYNFLYPLYRILDEYRPKSILEFHLGQATKMVAQYAERHRASHMVLENDRERVAYLTRLWKVPWDYTTFCFSTLRDAQANGQNGVIYQDFAKAVENRRYDLLLLKSPIHGKPQVHLDVLIRFAEILSEDFAVLIDHTEAECGDMVFRSMTGILEKHGIPCIGKRFSAPEREAGLLFSARWK